MFNPQLNVYSLIIKRINNVADSVYYGGVSMIDSVSKKIYEYGDVVAGSDTSQSKSKGKSGGSSPEDPYITESHFNMFNDFRHKNPKRLNTMMEFAKEQAKHPPEIQNVNVLLFYGEIKEEQALKEISAIYNKIYAPSTAGTSLGQNTTPYIDPKTFVTKLRF